MLEAFTNKNLSIILIINQHMDLLVEKVILRNARCMDEERISIGVGIH